MAITLEALREFFENTRRLRSDGRARFDIDGVCRWSFFFVDTDEAKLVTLGLHLEEQGYEGVGLLRPNPEDGHQETLFLRADRVEVHSVDSLHMRNGQLEELAVRFGIAAYDGMDVGAVDGP
jgi:hypothetical protein